MRLTFESLDSVKHIAFTNASDQHKGASANPLRTEQSTGQKKAGITIPLPACLSWDVDLLPALSGNCIFILLVLRSLDLNWPIASTFLSLSCRQLIVGLVRFHNYMNHCHISKSIYVLISIYLSIYLSICHLLNLFLWITLANINTWGIQLLVVRSL